MLLLAWLVVLVGGMLLNLRFDMIGKHLYYAMPAGAIACGLVLSRLWLRGLGRAGLPSRPRRCRGAGGAALGR